MSTINVTNLSGRGGATPNLPDGANITGVATATSFDGNLKSTGTPTLGLGVTINASGLAISGVATAGIISATTLYGDGSNLTGVGESIAPWHYNPDVNDTLAAVGTGIGITFNKKIYAGSGAATLKIVNAGVAGTTIQSWGISSATLDVTALSLGALVSDLVINQTYQVDIPEGFIVDGAAANYAGTAYTFSSEGAFNKLFAWGRGIYGQTLQQAELTLSSPVQVPSPAAWKAGWSKGDLDDAYNSAAIKKDGTLWMWGNNGYGVMGVNTANNLRYSSPVQIPGTTWSSIVVSNALAVATKTDNTLWAWGYNETGALGQNNEAEASSPVQIPGTTWSDITTNSGAEVLAIKTDGTLWAWGYQAQGQLGQNQADVKYSSPVQIPGTTWRDVVMSDAGVFATKTDNTLWAWGSNSDGGLGLNQPTSADASSPIQIPGTNWALIDGKYRGGMATKTDGTLWTWGNGSDGNLGVPSVGESKISSPVQVPGTTWGTSNRNHIWGGFYYCAAIKTDGTLWTWGHNNRGQLGQNQPATSDRSSPVQVGSRTDWDQVGGFAKEAMFAIQADETP